MSIETRTWTGAAGERFTWEDMARVEANANEAAEGAGVPTADFLTPSREGQFRWDEAQRLERLLGDTALALGEADSYVHEWAAGRTVTYVDMNRWEQGAAYLDAQRRKAAHELTWAVVRGRTWTTMRNVCVW